MLAPAMRVLAGKLTRLVLVVLAVVLALGSIGIDLTAFAVFSGAIGVGVGFGLQKVVSNLVSGVILLLDRSIKPGDVIELDGTYGFVNALNARYAAVTTRDGKEFLIPNEDLITQRVTNWSYSNDLIRMHVKVGISYQSDPHTAIGLALEAAREVPRVLAEPPPNCLLVNFGDSTIDLELRFWISDPVNGTANVRSAVMLRIWDMYQASGIELPNPQRDITLRNPESLAAIVRQAQTSAAVAGEVAQRQRRS
jgi:small-conductance mechanosensitive channel